MTVDGSDKLAEAATDVELVRAPNRIEKLREVKDDSEVLLLKELVRQQIPRWLR